ncbi:MAG: NAD(P)H-binding protein [Candidatus Limnocylindrales bacterium]
MTKHILSSRHHVPADIGAVWDFFSSAANLERVTPRSVGFDMHTQSPSVEAGSTIDYTIRPLFGIPVDWRTRIESVDAPHRFRDVQERGPYKSWVHEHEFTPVEGGVRMDDRVEYEMPFGPLGSLAHRLAVQAQLQYVFDFRTTAIDQIFEPATRRDDAPPSVVAVAGGTGFVGGEIARELRRRGRHVIVLSSRGEGARGQLPDDIEIRLADIRDPAALRTALEGVDELVVSLAFPGLPVEQPKKGFTFEEVDAGGTENLVAAGRDTGVTSIVYISGAGAAHDAEHHWFRAKARAEDAVRASGMRWTAIRPTWVYGPGDVSLNRFLGFARSLPFVPMTNFGGQQLAPVFVRDVAELVADALTDDAAAEQVFEIGGPESMSMREVLHRAMDVTGRKKLLFPAPAALVKVAAWPMRFLPNPPLSPDAVDFVNQPATVDVEPLLQRMPRTLTPFEQGLGTYLGPQHTSVQFADATQEAGPAA